MVRDYLATVAADDLSATRRNPHSPEYPETILSCLHTILDEEWEHHRYAVRDLDAMSGDVGGRVAQRARDRQPSDEEQR
jgi:hypothetical protein